MKTNYDYFKEEIFLNERKTQYHISFAHTSLDYRTLWTYVGKRTPKI
jgi:hypothetical protein